MPDQINEPVTYWDYLKLDRLLGLQNGLETDDNDLLEDELHFIVVHQVFELWFKLILREIRMARDRMAVSRVDEEVIPIVVHHLKRVSTILELAVKQFDVMETLTPQDFLEFRSKLGTASGFQSYQLRELELLLGLEQPERKAHGHGDPIAYIMKAAGKPETGKNAGKDIIARLEKANEEPSLRDVIHRWLYRTPIQGSDPATPGDVKVIRSFLNSYLAAMRTQNERQIKQLLSNGNGGNEKEIRQRFETVTNQAEQFLLARDFETPDRKRISRIRMGVLFIESYRELPLLAWPRLLLDTLVELEEQFLAFRFRHARMVERIIGRRIGTGGSAGVDYLDTTTKYRIFKELWAVRTLLLPRNLLPKLEKSEFFGFSSGPRPGHDSQG